MQRIKRVTISSDGDITRPLVAGDTGKKIVDTNWSSEIGTFLAQCGVDAYYGEVEGFEDDWLVIRGHKLFIFGIQVTTSTNGYALRFQGPAQYTYIQSNLTISDFTGIFDLNFCGNPNGLFVFRIFATDKTFFGGFAVGEVFSTLSLKNYLFYQIVPRSTTQLPLHVVFNTLDTDSGENALSVEKSGTLGNIPDVSTVPFIGIDIGNNMPLYPILYGTVSNSSNSNVINLHYNLGAVGVYNIPDGFDIPSSNLKTELYQKEILINGRKFLLGGTASSNTFAYPLIALDDDDPLITEDELMAEVNR